MNIFEMAQKAGWNDGGDCINIEKFADLVAAQEREECAKACEEVGQWPSLGPKDCAYAIRERETT
jgi:hypothetical protein